MDAHSKNTCGVANFDVTDNDNNNVKDSPEINVENKNAGDNIPNSLEEREAACGARGASEKRAFQNEKQNEDEKQSENSISDLMSGHVGVESTEANASLLVEEELRGLNELLPKENTLPFDGITQEEIMPSSDMAKEIVPFDVISQEEMIPSNEIEEEKHAQEIVEAQGSLYLEQTPQQEVSSNHQFSDKPHTEANYVIEEEKSSEMQPSTIEATEPSIIETEDVNQDSTKMMCHQEIDATTLNGDTLGLKEADATQKERTTLFPPSTSSLDQIVDPQNRLETTPQVETNSEPETNVPQHGATTAATQSPQANNFLGVKETNPPQNIASTLSDDVEMTDVRPSITQENYSKNAGTDTNVSQDESKRPAANYSAAKSKDAGQPAMRAEPSWMSERLEIIEVTRFWKEILESCGQESFVSFETAINSTGVFKLVSHDHCSVVIEDYSPEDSGLAARIIPVLDYKPAVPDYQRLRTELLITTVMQSLSKIRENTFFNFTELRDSKLVLGNTPTSFYMNLIKTPLDQELLKAFQMAKMFAIFKFKKPGIPLSKVKAFTKDEVDSCLYQMIFTLARAEHSLKFEYRALRPDQIYVASTPEKFANYKFDNRVFRIPTHGIKITMSDFSQSRISLGESHYYGGPPTGKAAPLLSRLKLNQKALSQFAPKNNSLFLEGLIEEVFMPRFDLVNSWDVQYLESFLKVVKKSRSPMDFVSQNPVPQLDAPLHAKPKRPRLQNDADLV